VKRIDTARKSGRDEAQEPEILALCVLLLSPTGMKESSKQEERNAEK